MMVDNFSIFIMYLCDCILVLISSIITVLTLCQDWWDLHCWWQQCREGIWPWRPVRPPCSRTGKSSSWRHYRTVQVWPWIPSWRKQVKSLCSRGMAGRPSRVHWYANLFIQTTVVDMGVLKRTGHFDLKVFCPLVSSWHRPLGVIL